jgi:hypothetical protein
MNTAQACLKNARLRTIIAALIVANCDSQIPKVGIDVDTLASGTVAVRITGLWGSRQ